MPAKKKVCLLTGAGGRLGNVICRHLSDEFNIVAVYRNNLPQWPSQEIEYINPLDPNFCFRENENKIFVIKADLYQDAELSKIVDITLSKFDKVDLLINAAVYYSRSNMIESDRLLNTIQNQFFLNSIVPLKLSILLARNYWKDRDIENREQNRSIINISSIAGLKVYKGLGQSGYSASKAALNLLTKHMAEEFSVIGVRVNAIAPNTFPRIVTHEEILKGITTVINDNSNGKILVMDKNDQYYT